MRFFFACDLHGSEITFRKFLNAIEAYKIEAAVMSGDLIGKLVVPVVLRGDEYSAQYLGSLTNVKGEQALQGLLKKIRNVGYYPYLANEEEMLSLSKDRAAKDELFLELAKQRLKEWMTLAAQRYEGRNIEIYVSAGNDDPLGIDETLDSHPYPTNATDRKVLVKGCWEMISLPYSNPTPWDTPRECDEETLKKHVDSMIASVTDMKKAIFNFHVPPAETMLDRAPKLHEDLRASGYEMVSVGSTAIKDAILTHQPLLSLHGHIHESRAAQNIGRTLCVNPGSEYGEGVLRGAVVNLEEEKVKNYLFVAG